MSTRNDASDASYASLDDDKPHYTETLNHPDDKSLNLPSPRSHATRLVSALTFGFTPGQDPHTDRSFSARRARLLLVLRAAIGEFIATFGLIFLTCAAALVVDQRSVDPGPAVLIHALTAGLTVTASVYAWYSISGCHMNPVITLSLLFTNHISVRRCALYIAAQLAGGQMAMAALAAIFHPLDFSVWDVVSLKPAEIGAGKGAAIDHTASFLSVFCMEAIGTCILVLTNFKAAVDQVQDELDEEGGRAGVDADEVAVQGAVAGDPHERDAFLLTDKRVAPGGASRDIRAARLPVVPIALAMGAAVAVLVGVGQASSGGAYNPARYLSSALWSGMWDGWWCWLVAEVLGCALGCIIHVLLESLAAHAMSHRWKAIQAVRREMAEKKRQSLLPEADEEKTSPA